jgi:hypothetical protein
MVSLQLSGAIADPAFELSAAFLFSFFSFSVRAISFLKAADYCCSVVVVGVVVARYVIGDIG